MDELYVTSAVSRNPKNDNDEGGKLFKVLNILLKFVTKII